MTFTDTTFALGMYKFHMGWVDSQRPDLQLDCRIDNCLNIAKLSRGRRLLVDLMSRPSMNCNHRVEEMKALPLLNYVYHSLKPPGTAL
jgi:hypothetical protein